MPWDSPDKRRDEDDTERRRRSRRRWKLGGRRGIDNPGDARPSRRLEMPDPQPEYLERDDFQQLRHGWRMLSEYLDVVYQELLRRSLPDTVIDAILIDQYNNMFHSQSEVEKMLAQMQLQFEQLFGKKDDDDD